MSVCKGCGIMLQTEDVNGRGYARSLDHEYCQSCFRLKHYRDFKRVKAPVDDGKTLEFIEQFSGHILWVVDVLRLGQSLHSGLVRALRGKRVVMLINKRDLLPKSVLDNSLRHHIVQILKDEHVILQDILFVSAKRNESLKGIYPYLRDDACAFVGSVNAGKSSLLNALLGKQALSVSPVASTTADVIELESEFGRVYDTPGLRSDTAILGKLSDEMLVKLAPQKTLKPQAFQLYEKQALLIGNLGAIIVDPVKTVNVISYLPFPLKRIKADRIEANLKLEHEFMISDPRYRQRNHVRLQEAFDFELFDLGFISIQGALKSFDSILDESLEFSIRKVLI